MLAFLKWSILENFLANSPCWLSLCLPGLLKNLPAKAANSQKRLHMALYKIAFNS